VDGRIAIYVENVTTGERVAIDADASYETFSVITVPLMAAVLERVREGGLSLSDRVTLTAGQRRIPSGVPLRARSRAGADLPRSAHADDHRQRQRSDRRAGRSRRAGR
jgi:hypothetical protein